MKSAAVEVKPEVTLCIVTVDLQPVTCLIAVSKRCFPDQ
jgi:hypothetical protein